MCICTLFTSIAQILYKYGVMKLPIVSTNWQLFLGLAVYFVAAAIMIIALKNDDVSTVYPILATSYIWVTILSAILFSEKITLLRIIGVLIIITGVAVIGFGGKNQKTGAPL